jgi:hypothetical protein
MNRQKLFTTLIAAITMFALAPVLRAEAPVLSFETTIPGYYLSSGRGITVDSNGNSYFFSRYVGGQNQSNILLGKIEPTGDVIWTLDIAGNSHDYAEGIVLDSSNDVLVTGWTDSENFPLVNAMDNELTGFREAFIMKLSGDDGSILFSTFLGGDYTDEGRGIVLNEAGEIYVVGSTGSTDFPTTPDAYQGEPSAPLYIYTDAFITKLSAEGDEILYSTYFGGFEDDVGQRIALDAEGNIVFGGDTNADDFPLHTPIQSDPDDIFVSKLSADGSVLLFSTYFGGEDIDRLTGMALDSEGAVYISGPTRSILFPTTIGAYQEDFVGEINGCEVPFGEDYNCEDVFLTKLNTDGSGLVYSTYLGGIEIDESRDIAVDSQGRAHVIGYTYSPDFPPNGIDYSAEIFVSRFDPSGSNLDYTFTIDSGSANAGHGIALNNSGDVYFTGAVNVPADIYVAKLSDLPDVNVNIVSSVTQVPRNSEFTFSIDVTNDEPSAQTITGWTAARRLPSENDVEPLIGPVSFTLQPGETQSFEEIRQEVGNIPLGSYRYFVRIGANFPEPVWDEDFFDINIIP